MQCTECYRRILMQNKVATLGPTGTFTEVAAKQYAAAQSEQQEIVLYPNFTQIFESVGTTCSAGVLPLENNLDGFVQRTLDLLLDLPDNQSILYELLLPIKFCFVSNAKTIEDTEKVYVQFKTRGQCRNFLENHDNLQIITTNSNGVSLNHLQEKQVNEAAIIPQHALEHLDQESYPCRIDNVTDHEENKTRFIIIGNEILQYDASKTYKTSIIIKDIANKPGSLFSVLEHFKEGNLNMTSLMSRPTKGFMGRYHFFIDIEGHRTETPALKQALDAIQSEHGISILGSYPVLQ